jgi:hypothetical protein
MNDLKVDKETLDKYKSDKQLEGIYFVKLDVNVNERNPRLLQDYGYQGQGFGGGGSSYSSSSIFLELSRL